MSTLDALKDRVLELSVAERAELAAFLEGVTPPAEPFVMDDEFRAEMSRRIEEMKSGAVPSVPGDEAMARVRARLQ